MTGTEVFAVVGAIVACVVSVGSAYRAYQRAKVSISMSPGLDAAAALLEEPEQ